MYPYRNHTALEAAEYHLQLSREEGPDAEHHATLSKWLLRAAYFEESFDKIRIVLADAERDVATRVEGRP